MAFIAGIDEAGRGPVIGPMVMAIVACKDEEVLKKRGMKDSKLLTPERRDELAEILKEDEEIKYEFVVLSPAEIDAAVLKDGDNLNKLEARTTALLIYRLAKRAQLTTVLIDSPTRTVAAYEREVRADLDKIDREGITKKILLRAECKADFNHAVVGAASIIAKTTRDAMIAEIAKKHGDIGSGYPADPVTQAFLESQWREGHEFFRKSWKSYTQLAKATQQSSLATFGASDGKHKQTVEAFEVLKEHGFDFVAPTNSYEIVRMKNDAVTIIAYTTGKVLVQGPAVKKKAAEALLKKLKLS